MVQPGLQTEIFTRPPYQHNPGWCIMSSQVSTRLCAWCLVHDQNWGTRGRQTAAVSLAHLQLMTNTTNTDTLHQDPKVLVWVAQLHRSLWPFTAVQPSNTKVFLHMASVCNGIHWRYRPSETMEESTGVRQGWGRRNSRSSGGRRAWWLRTFTKLKTLATAHKSSYIQSTKTRRHCDLCIF